MLRTLPILLALSLVVTATLAQEAQPDAQQAFEDPLLDELVGQWAMEGSLMGEPVEYSLKADWVLRHQFLVLEMRDIAVPSQYEATIYIGRDPETDRYVVHWLDQFGGRPSATLGFGKREDNVVRLVFDYPSGQFRDTFSFNRESGSWHFRIEAQTPDGSWSEFADHILVKNKPEP